MIFDEVNFICLLLFKIKVIRIIKISVKNDQIQISHISAKNVIMEWMYKKHFKTKKKFRGIIVT